MKIKECFNEYYELFEINQIVTTTNILKKIKECATEIFSKINTVMTFPLRFFGSKTWSLPGLLLRMPVKFCMKKPLIDDNVYHRDSQKNLTPNELRKFLKFAAVSTASFECDFKWIDQVENLEFHRLQPDEIDPNDLPVGVTIGENFIIDVETGLNLVICENENQVIIAFGALNAHNNKVDENQRKRLEKKEKNSLMGNFFGASPCMYKKASNLVELIKKSKICEGKKITLTGQSMGGSLATYVAIKQKLSAVCINSFPLGAGLQFELGKSSVSMAHQHVTQISVKNDIFNDNKWIKVFDKILSFSGIRTPGIFGKKFSIPSAYSDRTSTHVYALGSIMKHLGYDVRTLPSEVINAENLNSKIE
jgi:hypothetical protein